MPVTKEVGQKLDRAKWGGRSWVRSDRDAGMLAYLAELVSELLMDSSYTNYSEAPGFEGPLNAFRKEANDQGKDGEEY